MNDIQRAKSKFRSSKIWKSFKHLISVKQNGLDYITHAKLRKYSNLHHMDLRAENYDNLSIEDNFVYVNHNTHCWIHEIYTYYRKDPAVLSRLKEVLDRMVQVNARN